MKNLPLPDKSESKLFLYILAYKNVFPLEK